MGDCVGRLEFKKSLERRQQGDEELTSRDLGWDDSVSWSVRNCYLEGGKQDGVQVINVDNGKLSFRICPTRGMGLLDAGLGDIRLGWDSPVKEVVHPQHIRLESRGGLGWLEGFNEWLVRCGLEYAGAPGKDRFTTNTGEESEMDLTLHGRIANIPASKVELKVRNGKPALIEVSGEVNEVMFYGPKLQLVTSISTMAGSRSLRVIDTVTNGGAASQEFQLIYHTNFGPPLLSEGARFFAPIRTLFPINDHSAGGLEEFDSYAGPTAGFVEEVFCMETLADREEKTPLMLANPSRNQAVVVRVSRSTLPYVSLWKSTAAVEEGYVTGIEPGTGFPFNRRVERGFGRLPKLEPGESQTFELEFQVLDSAAEIEVVEQEIQAIQKAHPKEIVNSPPSI